MTTIAEYISKVGVSVDMAQLNKVDRYLALIDAKMKRAAKSGKGLSLDISKFAVDQTKLNLALGNALDRASRYVTFEITKFSVNDRNLSAAMLRASRRLPPMPVSQSSRQGAGSRAVERGIASRSVSRGIGGVGLYGSALALAGGGYGLSQLNQRNQQVVAAQLQSQAVVQQAGGTAAQGSDSFAWLKSQGNRIGFNYLDAAPDYNKLLSGLTGAGMSVSQGQGVFQGFSELARVNKLDRVQQQRVFRALSQVAGKGKLQSEELVGQLAESLPGATSLFATAYQNQLKATGKGKGDKTGQAAITELLAAMKKGQVNSGILTYAGDVASQKAAPGLGLASKASQAEQARFQNATNDLAVLASDSGVEEGFARLFRTLSTGLSDNTSLVQRLSEGFNQATIEFSKLALIPQSFSRALDGKQSQVADWLGMDKINQYRTDLESIQAVVDAINRTAAGSTNPFLNFGTLAKNTANDITVGTGFLGGASRWLTNTGLIAGAKYDESIEAAANGPRNPWDIVPGTLAPLKGAARATGSTIWNAAEQLGSLVTYTGSAWLGGKAPDWNKYESPIQYGNYINDQNPDNAKNMARDAAMNQATNNSNNTFNVTISLGMPGNGDQDLQRAGQVVGQAFRNEIETAGLRFSKTQ